MRLLSLSSLAAAVVAALAACGTPATTLDAVGAQALDALEETPERAGALIYRGAVFPLQQAAAPQVFTYERRVSATRDGLASAHITRDTRGDVVVVESAQFSPSYEVTRFEAIHREAGYHGSVVITGGRHLQFELNQGGKVSTASETVRDPVVTGPSLHGYILDHWETLARGEKLPVRMVVMAKKQTYGFEIQRDGKADGDADRRVAFSIRPTSLLVGLIVDPLRVEFDPSTHNVMRYIGRVPPMQRVDGKLRALDARVEYTMNVPAYL